MSKAIDRAVTTYTKAIIRWRWLVIIATLLAVMGIISGARFLSFTSDYRVFFSDENPQLTAYEELQNTYTQTDNVLFVLKPAEGTVFTQKWLGVVKKLTDASWKIPYSIRVDSLSNFQHTEAVGDDLTVADLIENPAGLDAAALKKVERIAQAEPVLAKRLISTDSTTTGVFVTMQFPPDDAIAIQESVEYSEKLAAEIEAANPGLRIAITGLAPLSNSFPRASQVDMTTLIPIMFAIILIAVFGFLRSIPGSIATMIITLLSAMAGMGFAGWMGIKLTPPAAMAPNIILTVAIADCIHILVSMFHEMRHGKSKHEALIESLRINVQPVFLTSLTTAIGFLSLNFSDAPPFHDLGNISTAGVLVAWVLSMTFLPALMSVLPVRVKARNKKHLPVMDKLAEFVIKRRTPLLAGMTILVIAMTAQVSRITLDDQFIEYFDKSIPFRVDSDFTRENLTGVYQIEYSIASGESGGVSNPDYLVKLEEFANWIRTQPGVIHVNTLTDTMKRLNKSMHGDDESWYKLPDARELSAQYLLLFEMSLPYGLDLNSQINVDKSASRLTVTLDNVSAKDIRDSSKRFDLWLDNNAPVAMHTQGTGTAVMFAYITGRNIRFMLGGTAIAFLLISATLMIALRSVKIGLISLIPNLVPAGMAFGLWGMTVGQIGIAASIVAASSLGLIVDASVHFLSKYLRARREKGSSPADAIRYGFHTVGTALWVTTAVILLGFGVLSQSAFKVNADMGLLMAITVAIALVVDFLLLPPLLMLLDRKPSLLPIAEPVTEPAQ